MNRKHTALSRDTGSDVRRLVAADRLQLKWIQLLLRAYSSETGYAANAGVTACACELHCEVAGNKQALGPVQQPGRHPMMLSDSKPFQITGGLVAYVRSGRPLKQS